MSKKKLKRHQKILWTKEKLKQTLQNLWDAKKSVVRKVYSYNAYIRKERSETHTQTLFFKDKLSLKLTEKGSIE